MNLLLNSPYWHLKALNSRKGCVGHVAACQRYMYCKIDGQLWAAAVIQQSAWQSSGLWLLLWSAPNVITERRQTSDLAVWARGAGMGHSNIQTAYLQARLLYYIWPNVFLKMTFAEEYSHEISLNATYHSFSLVKYNNFPMKCCAVFQLYPLFTFKYCV